MLSVIKKIMLIILSLTGILALIVVLFISLNPQMGKAPHGDRLQRIQSSKHFSNGKFQNVVPTQPGIKDWSKMPSIMSQFIFGRAGQRPQGEIPVLSMDSLDIVNNNSETRLTWFGHSAFLLEMDNKKILIDPMLGSTPAPASWLGSDRFSTLPLSVDQIPETDAIIISHDHYDHLDYGSIQKLKSKTGHFFVPLGVGSHLEDWGVSPEMITELEWWEEIQFKNLTLVCTPARHFSGRSLNDRDKTLWSGWVITGEDDRIYFSGDGGYFEGFKEIGSKYGPFDIAMIECGQYNENWSDIHMMPEESVQAALDLNAKVMIPIHWGTFQLSVHRWDDPVKRAVKEAEKLGVSISTPKIGEPIWVKNSYPNERWWLQVDNP